MKNYIVKDLTDNLEKIYNVIVQDEQKEKLSDNVWFTRKARIQSEKRLKSNHTHTQLLLVVYSLFGAILSVVILRHNDLLGADTDIVMAVFSIVILVISLVLTNFNFKERSDNFRKNYIHLQKIYFKVKKLEKESQDLTNVSDEYNEVLLSIENHELIDDICARVENYKTLNTRIPTKGEHCICKLYKTLRFFTFSLLYILPFILILIMFFIK